MISENLEHYKIFNAAAECRNLSRAAEKLYMTQSAVSQAIRQLELSLSVTLFTRSRKGVELTEEGRLLYDYTSQAIELLNTAEKRIESRKELSEGELRIGASDTISSHFLLDKLERFHSLYPKINLQVVNRVTNDTISLLKNGSLDIAFGNLPINDEQLEVRKCLDVHDVFVCGSEFVANMKESYSSKELSDLPLILLEKKSNSRNYVDRIFSKSGLTLKPVFELGAHELLLQFAQINLGISCVIREFSQKYLDDRLVFELPAEEPLPERAIGCYYPKNIMLSPAAKKFLELINK